MDVEFNIGPPPAGLLEFGSVHSVASILEPGKSNVDISVWQMIELQYDEKFVSEDVSRQRNRWSRWLMQSKDFVPTEQEANPILTKGRMG